jgi:hypothetical protein
MGWRSLLRWDALAREDTFLPELGLKSIVRVRTDCFPYLFLALIPANVIDTA